MDDKGRKLEEGGQQEEKDKDARELEQENASQQEMEEVYRKSVKKKQRNMKKRQALPSCWRGEIVAPDAPVAASAAFSVPQGEENGEEQKEQQQERVSPFSPGSLVTLLAFLTVATFGPRRTMSNTAFVHRQPLAAKPGVVGESLPTVLSDSAVTPRHELTLRVPMASYHSHDTRGGKVGWTTHVLAFAFTPAACFDIARARHRIIAGKSWVDTYRYSHSLSSDVYLEPL
jgi:hypothetical protein